MINISRIISQAAKVISIVCCLIFVLFSFTYLYGFQGDMMQMVQHLMSDGRTSYKVFLFSTIITILLTASGFVLERFLHFPLRFKALAWFPSFFVLGWLTDVSLDIAEPSSRSVGVFPFILFALIYVGVIYLLRRIEQPILEKAPLQSLIWPNFLILIVSEVFTVSVGNTNRTLHYELRMERFANEERFDKLLEVGEKDPNISRRIMYLRVYALSKKGELGDKLFQYPNNLGSESLLPEPLDSLRPCNMPRLLEQYLGKYPIHDMNATAFLQYIAGDTIAKEPVHDYLLCSLLLDRNLSVFADSLISYYAPKDSLQNEDTKTNTLKKTKKKGGSEPIHFDTSLPKHYAEALVLYTRLHENPIAVLDDEKTLQNYLDFSSYRETADTVEREIQCRRYYNDTYWCYYFFDKPNNGKK